MVPDTRSHDAAGGASVGPRTLTTILTVLVMSVALVGAPVAAQSPSPSAPGDVTGTCGVVGDTTVQIGTADLTLARVFHARESLPFADLDSPLDLSGSPYLPYLDVLGGAELPLRLQLADATRPRLTSLVAVLVLAGRDPIWLGPSGPDHASVIIPVGTEGSGVLHVLAGTCDDWTFTASWPITIADPDVAAACPTDTDGLRAWFEDSDQRIRVAGTPVDSMGFRGEFRGRYIREAGTDTGEFVGSQITPQDPPVRLEAGERFTVRARDRSVAVVAVTASFAGRPTAREIRTGWIYDFRPPSIEGRARLDGQGGFTMVAPREPGRYVLVMDPVWLTGCVRTQGAQLVLLVTVR